ncbi:hypothetical protein [Sporosarcina sp. FSL K6-2383]|uniref:helix-turn-helix transcriptional regulator n=1 Tax=Sporosarcina sp. FSL K6-2383 TaxID=2921556 RepID=UPI00315A3E8F
MTEENIRKEMEQLGISEETVNSMKRLFLKMSVPRFIEEKRKEEERERLALDYADNQLEAKRLPMRRIRGVKSLVEYLESIDCPISESTIYRLVRVKTIPFRRPSPQVLIFDLDDIDYWLSSDYEEASQ